MRPIARHLGLVVLVLGACALMGAAPKKAPAARPAKAGTKATSAKVTAATPAKTTAGAKSTSAAKAAPAAAAMRISREPDAGAPVGGSTGAVIEYVEPIVEEVGVPILNVKADGSIEMILNGTGQDFTTITLGKNGARQILCDQGHDHSARASKSAKATPAPSAQPEER